MALHGKMIKILNAYLHSIEEAEKRDHRKLGKEMNLFHFQEEAPGMVFWHPNGGQYIDYFKILFEIN